MTITSLQPILALHLERYGYTAVFIGFSFAIPTLVYASTTPLIYLLTSKFKKSTVILLGYGFTAGGMFLVGTSKLLGVQNTPAFIIFGLAVMGFGCGLIITPVLPDMMEAVEERYPKIDDNSLANQISGLFIACQGLGETLGPVFGSVSENIYGFRITQDILACTLVVFMAAYFLFCGGISLIGLNKTTSSLASIDDNQAPRKSEEVVGGERFDTEAQKNNPSSLQGKLDFEATKDTVTASNHF
jgi:MFS family permease